MRKWIAVAVLVIVYGLAGESDYQDAKLTEARVARIGAELAGVLDE